MFKLPIFLVILSIFQVGFASVLRTEDAEISKKSGLGSRAELVVELSDKIVQLQSNITSEQLGEGTSLADYVRVVRSYVDVGKEHVSDSLKNLDEQVKKATSDAKEQHINIDACIKSEKKDKKQINLGEISKCSTVLSLDVLKLKLAKFSALSLKTNFIITRCTLSHPFDDNLFEECVLEFIADYDQEMKDIKESIEAEASELVNQADVCVLNNGKILLDGIDAVLSSFNLCVGSSENPELSNNRVSGSRSELVAELSAKIVDLQSEIKSAQLEEGTSLAKYINTDRSNVDVPRKKIDGQVKELDDQVKAAKSAAQKAKKNIDACVKAEKKDRNSLYLRSINKCSNAWSLNVLKLSLAKYSVVSLKSDTVITRCFIAHPLDNDAFEKCAVDLIADYDKQTKDIGKSIESDAQDLVKKSELCARLAANDLDEAISFISNNFDKCVASV